jgi:hypothetical protein
MGGRSSIPVIFRVRAGFGQGVFQDLKKSWKIRFCDFGYGKVMEIYVLAVNKIQCRPMNELLLFCITNI